MGINCIDGSCILDIFYIVGYRSLKSGHREIHILSFISIDALYGMVKLHQKLLHWDI